MQIASIKTPTSLASPPPPVSSTRIPAKKAASLNNLHSLRNSPVHARLPKAVEISNYSLANESGPKQSQAPTDERKMASFLAKGHSVNYTKKFFSSKHTDANISVEEKNVPRSLTRPRSISGKRSKNLNQDLLVALQTH